MQAASPSSTTQAVAMDPVELLGEVMLNSLQRLKTNDLLACSLVSRKWREFASDNSLWKQKAQLIGIAAEPGLNLKSEFSKRIANYTSLAAEADKILLTPVKTARQFDAVYYSLKGRRDPEAKATIAQITRELAEKLNLSDTIKDGSRSHMMLRRVGRSSWDKIEEYARVRTNRYGDDRIWNVVALEYCTAGQLQKGLSILKSQEDNHDKCTVLSFIIRQMCEKEQIDEAFKTFKENFPCLKQGEPLSNRCFALIYDTATHMRRYDLHERLIVEMLEDEHDRRYWIIQVISILCRQNELAKAKELYFSYKNCFDKSVDMGETHFLIESLVAMSLDTDAYQLAQRVQPSDDLALYVLRNAYERYHSAERVEEINQMIAKAPHKTQK